jgi:hypothetical protein
LGTRKAGAIIGSAVLLLLVMQVRYIALFYPAITLLAVFLTYFRVNKVRFLALSALQLAIFFGVISFTTWQTKRNIGVAVLSGFSGWQKANNAMHVLPYISLKPAEIKDPGLRRMHAFILSNNPPGLLPAKDSLVISYLWSPDSPLKKHLNQLRRSGKRPYLYYWHLSSVDFGKWGDFIIKKYPGLYFRHYLVPNARSLLNMPNEALFYFPPYSEQMKNWFRCGECDDTPKYTFFHRFLAATASKSFNLLWVFLVLSCVALCFRPKLSTTSRQYDMILLVSFFCIMYTAMSLYASPVVLRYLLAIRHSLLLVPFLLASHFVHWRKS